MSLSTVDCMACLVNVARGLETENDLRIRWQGVVHAVAWEMGPGRVAAACLYERVNPYGRHHEWRRRK